MTSPVGNALRVDFWALADDNTYLAPLPHVAEWTVSQIAGKPGGIQLSYPRTGLGAELLDERVTRRRDLPIAIRVDGTAGADLRGRLYGRDGSDVDETGLITYSGYFVTQRLEDYELGPGPGENGEHTFPAATAGRIMREVLELAQADGALLDLTWGFTDTLDSGGVAWSQVTTAEFGPGTSLAAIAAQLRSWRMAEHEVTSALQVALYEPGTVGVDHTLADPPVILRAGRDVVEDSRRTDSRGVPTALLVEGADGIYVEVDDPTAEAIRGRRIVRSVSQGGLTTTGAALAYGQLELEVAAAGQQEVQLGLAMHPDQPMPLRDLRPSDWVWRDTTRALERERIVQLTVSQKAGDDHPSGSVVLGDLLASHAEALQAQIDGLTGGQIVAGVSTPDPDVDDGTIPAQVLGVTVDSQAYTQQGATLASVVIDWAAVVENTDGSQITDLDRYEPQYAYDQAGLPVGWISLPATPADTTITQVDGIVADAVILARVRAVDRWERAGAYSSIATHLTDRDDQAPPTPSAPAPFPRAGVILVPWDGQGAAGETQPVDYLRSELHRSTSAAALPDRPLVGGVLDEAASATYRGDYRAAMTLADEVPTASYGTTYYYRLVSVDRSGNASAASAAGAVIAQAAQDGELAGLSVGKLLAGIIDVVVGIGQRLYAGDPAGAGWEGDPAGFRFYTGTGINRRTVLDFVAATGLLNLVGRFATSELDGARIEIDPVGPDGNPTMSFFSDNGVFGAARLNAYDVPGLPGRTGLGINSGGDDADGNPYGRVVLQPDVVEMKMTGPGQADSGGVFRGFIDQATVRVTDTGGTELASLFMNSAGQVTMRNSVDGGVIQLQSDGNVFIGAGVGRELTFGTPAGTNGAGFTFRAQSDPDNQGYRTAVAGGTLAFVRNSNNQFVTLGDGGGAYKNFVIDHPLDADRWLVHACTEGPSAGVEHHGVAEILDHQALVELPNYFEAATRAQGRQVQVTALLDTDPSPVFAEPAPLPRDRPVVDTRRPVEVPESSRLPIVAASIPHQGRFRITSSAATGRVAWRVFAVRADAAPLDPEPRRDTVHVGGSGPYRFITTRQENP